MSIIMIMKITMMNTTATTIMMIFNYLVVILAEEGRVESFRKNKEEGQWY